jgi:integrase/recombinase XerD
MAKMQPWLCRAPCPCPEHEEVRRLIAAARNIKHQAACRWPTARACAPARSSRLKVGDVDSQRMTLRVEQGKGAKDRYAMLSPVLLQRLRAWWRLGHAQGKICPAAGCSRAWTPWTAERAPAQPRRA